MGMPASAHGVQTKTVYIFISSFMHEFEFKAIKRDYGPYNKLYTLALNMFLQITVYPQII